MFPAATDSRPAPAAEPCIPPAARSASYVFITLATKAYLAGPRSMRHGGRYVHLVHLSVRPPPSPPPHPPLSILRLLFVSCPSLPPFIPASHPSGLFAASHRRSLFAVLVDVPPSHARTPLPPRPCFPSPPLSPHSNKALSHLLPILHSVRLATLQKAVLTWCVGVTDRRGVLRALVDDELAREEADVDVEAGVQGAAVAQHVPGLVEAWRAGSSWRVGELEDADPAWDGAEGAGGANDVDLVTMPRVVGAWHRVGARTPALSGPWENRLHHEPDGARCSQEGGREGEGVLHAVEVARGHTERGVGGGCEAARAAHFDKGGTRDPGPRRALYVLPRGGAALLSEEGLVAEYRCVHCVRPFSMRALVCDK
ncbi:hypothetical protein C8J57DRAFT_1679859 [Mycena rebaudengoi]|nr:hypothetical protein C8J57DRAFT_1679859 [Mycena rebaudengoi]